MKDYALQHPVEPAPEGTRKPKLVLLIGKGHKDSIKEVFDELGLDMTYRELDTASDQDRYDEHTIYKIGQTIAQLPKRETEPKFVPQKGARALGRASLVRSAVNKIRRPKAKRAS